MPEKQELTIVRVFIASPSDLQKERRAFENVIKEANDIKAAEKGIRLEPVGWEDMLPGKGRPQALINEDLLKCDLVVGLLWRRWGSSSGEYTSGFEEEFELARKHDMEMWLYFRDVEEAMMADPGKQLRQVLDFRDRIEREKEFLYHRYANAQEWERKLLRHLCLWLDKLPQDRPPEVAQTDEQAERIRELEAELAKLNDDKAKAAFDLVKDAWECADNGQLTKAEEYFARAIDLTVEPSMQIEYALFLKRIGELDKAIDIYQDLLQLGEDTESQELIANAAGNLGNIYCTRRDLDEAELMHRKALNLFEALGHKKGMASQYGNLGTLYGIRGDLEEAEAMFKKSLVINEAQGWRKGMANQYGNLGNVLNLRDDYAEAETMYKKAIAIEKTLGHKDGIATAYGNLGIVYHLRGDLDEAEAMYKKSLELFEMVGHKEGMARNYAKLGIVYYKRGDFGKAEAMSKKSLELFKMIGNQHNVAIAKAFLEDLEAEKQNRE